MKSAVVYYSNSGQTKQIATAIGFRFKADLYFVEPEQEYGGFVSSVYKVIRDHSKKVTSKPKTKMSDFSQYDTIFLGFPVWAGSMPEFLQLYVKKANWKGKRVIPFVTAAGTGKESALACVEQLLPDSEVTDYFYRSNIQKMNAENWMDEIEKKYC